MIRSFTNAIFQEHLAASLLSKLSYEQIICHCGIGKTHPKIKTKWIQTISSTLSLLEPGSDLFKQLIKFIEDDNIELIFQMEPSQHTPDFRLQALKKLVDKCREKNIRPIIVYEETIGAFMNSTSSAGDYLMDCIENQASSDLNKIVCTRILKACTLTAHQETRFLNLTQSEIQKTFNSMYAGPLVDVLSANKIGDKKLIETLISMDHLADQHAYRSEVYELITVLGLVEDFYDYGLNGIYAFRRYNATITHSGSECNLLTFLLSTQNINQLTKLLVKDKTTGQFPFIDNSGFDDEDFLNRLFERLVDVFEKNPSIIVPVAGFIKDLGKRYRRQEARQVDNFLETTGTYSLIVRLLISNIMKDRDWELGGLITEDSYDYVLREYEEGDYNLSSLQNCLSGIQYKQNIIRQ